MKRNLLTYLAVAITAVCAWSAEAGTNSIPWRVPYYSLTAREMPVVTVLDTFGVAQGIPVVASKMVVGVVSGNFNKVPATVFLDRLATIHNLIWYYDGATIYVYGSSETQTMLMDLKYMKADEVRGMLLELGVEDERFPIRTASNGEMIMVSGPPRYVAFIAEMVQRADSIREQRTFTRLETRIFPLKYTWADTVSISISTPESTASIKGIAQVLGDIMKINDPLAREGTNSNHEVSGTTVFQPIILPDNRLNAVVVRDLATNMPMYERLIKELDVPVQLVEIAISVIEMKREDALDWQLSLSVNGTHNDFTGAAGQNAANLFGTDELEMTGLEGAITYLGKNFNLAASLSALKSKSKARNISRTTILTMNNFGAEMTDTQSYHARMVGEKVASMEEVSAGTTLQLKPRIVKATGTNEINQVWLTLQLQDGGFETVTVDAMPMTRTTTLKTQAAVFEDESLLLAGYLRDVDEEGGWGIPFLRDLPLVGWIFGGKSVVTETMQRMFILTPRIVNIDTECLVRKQATRARDIREVEAIEDDLEESDNERALRTQERDNIRDRRREAIEDQLERREAEIEHEREMRAIGRDQARAELDAERKVWRDEEADARAKLPVPEPKVTAEPEVEVEAPAEPVVEVEAPAEPEMEVVPEPGPTYPAKPVWVAVSEVKNVARGVVEYSFDSPNFDAKALPSAYEVYFGVSEQYDREDSLRNAFVSGHYLAVADSTGTLFNCNEDGKKSVYTVKLPETLADKVGELHFRVWVRTNVGGTNWVERTSQGDGYMQDWSGDAVDSAEPGYPNKPVWVARSEIKNVARGVVEYSFDSPNLDAWALPSAYEVRFGVSEQYYREDSLRNAFVSGHYLEATNSTGILFNCDEDGKKSVYTVTLPETLADKVGKLHFRVWVRTNVGGTNWVERTSQGDGHMRDWSGTVKAMTDILDETMGMTDED